MKKSYIRKCALCLSLTALIGTAGQAQSLLPERLVGITERQLIHADGPLEWQHITQLFPGQSPFTADPYLYVWSERETSRTYTRREMQELLRCEPTSIDRERMRLVLALDYLEEGRRLLSSGASLRSEGVETALSGARLHLEGVNPVGLVGKEYTQWLVARAYTLMALPEPRLSAAKALLSEATQQDDAFGERALLYLAMLEHAEGRSDVAIDLLGGQQWSAALAPEARYQQVLIWAGSMPPDRLVREVQEATRLYPVLAKRPRLLGVMGIAYYRLGDWHNVVRTLEPLGSAGTRIPAEHFALGSAYYALGQYAEAVAPLEEATTAERNPLSALAQYALANIYAHRGDYERARLAYASVVEAQGAGLPSIVTEEALYRLIELNFASGQDAFGRQTRLVERFLSQYAASRHTARVLELLRQYCHSSTDYAATLALLRNLSDRGIRLEGVRQEVLVRYAAALGSPSPEFAPLLEEAISLGSGGVGYATALLMQGQHLLQSADYAAAERSLRRALSQQPWGERYASGLGHYLLGYALYNQKRYAEAYNSFARYSAGGGAAAERADALARMGDCLMNDPKRHTEALRHYEEAIAQGAGGRDEAHRRIVGIYGLRGEYGAQIREANRFIEAYPSSAYLPEVLYLKGKALSLEPKTGGRGEAHQVYSRVEQAYPSSPYASLSALERALLYASAGDHERAIPAYKRVVEQYPASQEARTALSDLRTLYDELDRLDEYVAYARGFERSRLPEDHNMEALSLQGIRARLRRGEAAAIADLRHWTESHPHSPDLYEAERLLAQSYIQRGQHQEAATLLGKMRKRHTASRAQLETTELLGSTHKALGHAAEMLEAYQAAYTLSKGDAERRTRLALTLSGEALQAGAAQTALEVTTEELRREGLASEARETLTLTKGKAQEQLKAIKGAIQTYATLEGSYTRVQGAEAVVRRAELMLRLGQHKEAGDLLDRFVESGTPQRYWLARGFIALSDCYAAQGEQYLAVQYLKNLRDSYENPEEDITAMITTRLKKLQK